MIALLLGCAAEDKPDDPSTDGRTMMAATGGAMAQAGAGGSPAHGASGAGSGGASTQSGHNDSGSALDPDGPDEDGDVGGLDGGVVGDAMVAMPQPMDWPPLEEAQIGAPVLISDAFSLAEGALWDPCLGALLFTDADTAVIHKLVPPDQISDFRTDSNYANGINFDPQGRLLIAEMGPDTSSGRITRVDRAGALEVVVDKGPADIALHTTDDLIARSDGTIYFTDPVFPHGPSTGVDLFGALPIYRLTPQGEVIEESTTRGPNGIVLSPDEKHLYVSSFFGDQVFVFDVADDGALSGKTPLITAVDQADSMCVDAAGNLYVGMNQGLGVFRPDGSAVTTIPIGVDVTNCGFGGDDGKTLYVTAWTSLYRVDAMPIPGLDWQVSQGIRCD